MRLEPRLGFLSQWLEQVNRASPVDGKIGGWRLRVSVPPNGLVYFHFDVSLFNTSGESGKKK
jgi:hypothetical protein